MAALEALERQVIAEAEQRFDYTFDSLRELARQPSTLGNERGAQSIVYARMSALGLSPEMWDLDLAQLRDHPNFALTVVDVLIEPERISPTG